MAGSGWRAWTRERLPSAWLQSFLQDQVVQNYTSRAARAATGPGAPSEGMVSWAQAERALEVVQDGVWRDPVPRMVGRFTTASDSGQINQATPLARISGTMNGTCRLRPGRIYRARWRAGFTAQAANQGIVIVVTITNEGATPATTDTALVNIGAAASMAGQAYYPDASGLFRVADDRGYAFSPWLRRAAISGNTGYVQSLALPDASGVQAIEITDEGSWDAMVANTTVNAGTVPLIDI